MTELSRLKSPLITPAAYRIRVCGSLGPEWSDWLQGMTVTVFEAEGEESYTVLSGRLPDQAALMGVLAHLYNCNIPIISIERASAENG